MNRLARQTLRLASAGVFIAALGACGGGAEPASPSLAQSIAFTPPADQTLAVASPLLTATASSGLAVSFASVTPAVCTVSGNMLTLLAAGTCTVSASQQGDATFAAAAPVSGSFTTTTSAQTITFISPGNQTLGSAPAPLMAASTSKLPVGFASTTPGVCAVSGEALALLAGGLCTVDASQPGNAIYAPAATVSHSFTVAVSLLAQSITFTQPADQTLGAAPVPLTASSTSGLVLSFASITPTVCTVSGASAALVAVGTCTVAASQAGDANFAAAVATVKSFAVAPTPQTINFVSPGNRTLGTTPVALGATATSGLAVSFASTTPNVCTVAGDALTLVATGTCSIAASQTGNATFAAATPVTNTFSVMAAPQTISFASPGNQTLGTTPAALAASSSAGLPVTLVSTTPAVCTVSGSTLTLVSVGTCTISASQAGNAGVAAAAPVANSVTVAAAPKVAQTIRFTSPGNQTLGTVPAALSATSTSGLAVSFASGTPGVCTVSGTTLTLVGAGTCTVNASQAGDTSYSAALTVSNTFTVALASQTINFASPGNQTLGQAPVALVATATSGLPVALASTTPSVCSMSGGTLSTLALGTCTVVATQTGNATFAPAAQVGQSIVVVASPLTAQTISFPSPGNQTVGTVPAALTATATSGLAVSFASITPGVCAVSGTTLTPLAAGTCTVNANQAGNALYAAAPTVARSVTVVAAAVAQTISFPSPGNQTLGTAPLALTASATSGLTVTFASTTPSVCTLSGSTLTLVGTGTCAVQASQGGNAAFLAAPVVSNTFTVSAAIQSISFVSPGLQLLSATPIALTATASSGLPVSFASTTPAVCTVSGAALTLVDAGACTLNASQPGNAMYAAAATVSVTFSVTIERFANGGFETVGATTPANAWLGAAGGYTLSADAHSGAFSAQLSSPAFNAAVMLQNSKDQGGLPDLKVGDSPTLSFWAKGTAGGTGNVLFALRYLDAVGNIKANSNNQFFQGSINPTTWTKITYNLGPVPAGAKAAFIEFSQGIGPIDASNPAGLVLIDDLSLKVEP